MAHSSVMTAVEAKFSTAWPAACASAGLSPVPAQYEANVPDKVPADGAPFVTIEYPVANETMGSLGSPGSNLFKEEGAFVITLYAPIGTGLLQSSAPWAATMDALRAQYRGKVLTVGGGFMTCWEASPPIFRDGSERGAYCELSVSVAYRFDVIG